MKKQILFLMITLLGIAVVSAQSGIVTKYGNNTTPKTTLAVEKSDFPVSSGTPAVQQSPDKGNKTALFTNVDIVTHPGQGPGGADYSWPWDDNSFGSSCAISGPFGIAVNFDIFDISWTVDSIRVYAYQTGSTTTSTLNDVRLQIWNGVPGAPGSTVIWGDLTTNRMTSTRFTGVYRGIDFTNTQRPIMIAVCNTPGLTLTQGFNYHVEFRAGGTLTSGPWTPPIIAGNDLQFSTGAYTNAGSEYPLDIYGTSVAASCPPVSGINSTNITNVSLDLGWTENGTATLWDIEYGMTGFTPTGTPTMTGVTTNPTAITGLTSGTVYDFYVRADCGTEQSGWTGPYSATTANCNPADQCMYTFNLIDDYGDGWNGASITVVEGTVPVASVTLATGATGSVSVPLCDASTVELIWVEGDWDEECGLTVLDPDNQVVYSFIAPNAPVAGTFHTFTVSCPSCPAPTGLAASNITQTSADLSWVAGTGTLWNAEIGAAGFTPGTGAELQANTGATTTNWAVSGLTPGTTYHLFVQNDCGGGTVSSWSAPLAFSTDCPPVTSFPWNEDFEGATFPPDCWKNIDADGDGFKWDYRDDPTGWPTHSGDKVAVSASWISNTILTPDNWLILPQFTIDNNNYAFSMWYAAQDVDYPSDKFSVMISTTGTNPTDFTDVFSTVITTDVFTQAIIPLDTYDGEDIFIAIRHWDCTDWYFMKIDDLAITQTGDIDISIIASMKLYPNPTTDFVYISEKANVEIYSVQGTLVGSYTNVNKIDVSNLNAGFYFFKAHTDGKTQTTKINVIR
jgi:hypothetical protein